ncbi:hypothetical protein ACTJKK_09720 [Microbacterium sp. 22179]|uniref:hypothetical protein n=1 Tax=Microbacterium sp. 22179 TaxID=3453886 RepID=UPI003F83953B
MGDESICQLAETGADHSVIAIVALLLLVSGAALMIARARGGKRGIGTVAGGALIVIGVLVFAPVIAPSASYADSGDLDCSYEDSSPSSPLSAEQPLPTSTPSPSPSPSRLPSPA